MTARHWLILIACVCVGGLIWVMLPPDQRGPKPADPKSRDAFEENGNEQLDAALTAMDAGDDNRVAELVAELQVQDGPLYSSELGALGSYLADQGRLSLAEWCLTRAIEFDPKDHDARLRLAKLYYISGEFRAAMDHWQRLLVDGGVDLISMPALGSPNLRWGYEDEAVERGLQADPNDRWALLARGGRALQEQDAEKGNEIAKRLLEQHPKWGPSTKFQLRMLASTGQFDQLANVIEAMPTSVGDDVEIWTIKGDWCRKQKQNEAAARCSWEAFFRNPNDYAATNQLAQRLHAQGHDRAAAMTARAEHLRKYRDVCRAIHSNEQISIPRLHQAAREAVALGCLREADGWCAIAQVVAPQEPWVVPLRAQFQSRLKEFPDIADPPSRWHGAPDPRAGIDLAGLPLPDWKRLSEIQLESKSGQYAFADIAEQVGIIFVFEDGADASTTETKLFEFTGGGVGVLDYDLNGRPDLFFVQGGPPPEFARGDGDDPRANSAEQGDVPTDKLYCNLTDVSALDVTEQSGLVDTVYGQGCAVGDLNGDGFPDLYIANVGANSIYFNNGDGTFSKADLAALRDAANWTTSCAIGDLNGDGFPDLYDVNYVTPPGIHADMCRSGEASVPCDQSHKLTAGQDRMLLSDGTGEYHDVTKSAGIVAADGIGLGVVVADFGKTGKLDLFVANDAKANFLFLNESDEGTVAFSNQALTRGVAYSAAGRAQACMGVAAGDANHDGTTDLFITNFYADDNLLYRQLDDQFFDDGTTAAGLGSVSYNLLGFGTQFLDADLDGDLDLILTNGDVVDFTSVEPERKYHQRPQFFENVGDGQFREVRDASIGSFFIEQRLGRGLARLDWNRDGLDDVAISHINSPASLLVNRLQTKHHFVDIGLVAVAGDRDATGARVHVRTTHGTITQEWTAGDGYMASNERRRRFGLGDAEAIESVTIEWLSGKTQAVSGVNVDARYLIVEGTEEPFLLP